VHQETSAAPGWYDDPERPGQLRYWDGSAWTDHRAGSPPLKAAAAPARPTEQPQGEAGEDKSFALVVAGVLGGAFALILTLTVVVIWVGSYNTGHQRGVQARNMGLTHTSAKQYCEETAKNTSQPGSADGSWDLPWIIGCKRGLG
jgi:hypothetical protein